MADTFFGGRNVMYTGKSASLKMSKPLIENLELDNNIFQCEIMQYDESGEKLLLRLKNNQIERLSLSAIYDCQISLIDKELLCKGIIKERYSDASGSIVSFAIETGIYEINVK